MTMTSKKSQEKIKTMQARISTLEKKVVSQGTQARLGKSQ